MKKTSRGILSIAAALVASVSVAASPIRLKSGEVDTSERVAQTAAASLYAAEDAVRVYLIQCESEVTPAWRATIEQAGGKVLGYVPDNAYLVAADGATASALASQVKYAYFGDYQPAYKLSASVQNVLAQAAKLKTASKDATFSASAYAGEFVLSVFPFAKAADVAEKISALSGCLVVEAEGCAVRARLSASAVSEILSWSEVEWLEPYAENELFNNVAVEQPRMNVKAVWPSGASGLGLTGAGQVVAVCDTGLDTGNASTLHQDVRGRVTRTYCYGRSGSWSDPDGHGTHVVGSVLGNGTKSSGSFKGVAYEANLIFQSILNSSGGLSVPSDLNVLFQKAYDRESGKAGARIHSNSWGAGSQSSPSYMGYYSSSSRAIDQFMFEHPDMLILYAAGNAGVDYNGDGVIEPDSISSQGTAKNCMTVGASENERTSGGYSGYKWATGSWASDFRGSVFKSDYISRSYDGSHQGMAAFSSRGPCDDGRIKPDIVAPGTDIVSMHSSLSSFDDSWGEYNAYYAYMGGTSMATPLTAGAAALVRQWLVEKQGISNPDGATVKAVMLAGAKSLAPGQYGTGSTREIPATYPNNVEGWGQVNLGNALANAKGVAVFDGKVIGHGETQQYKVTVASAGSPLAIVMTYMDAPASLSASAQLVNDLDLTVVTPSGTKLYPNSRTSADRVNNVEGVRIAVAEKGVYTVSVNARSVTTPMSTSWTGGKANATRYSVAVNGATESASLELSACFLSNQSATLDAASSVTEFQRGETVYAYGRLRNPNAVDWSGSLLVKHVVRSGSVTNGSYTVGSWQTISAGGHYDIAALDWESLQNLAPGSYTYEMTVTAGIAEPVRRTVSFRVDEPDSPLSSVVVQGASTVGGGSKSTYTCRATLADGTVVTASPVWTIDTGSAYAKINQNGTLETYATEVARSVVIRASCTYNGVTRSGTKSVAINPVITLPVALNCPAWTITSGGDAEWFGQKTVTHDGQHAAQSGAIAHGKTTWFETTLEGAGTLSFWYRVSTELNYDELVVSADGVTWFRASGESVWAQQTITLGAGSHVVRFAYVKDVNGASGSDAVYLDQLAWTSQPTPESLTITGDGTVVAGSELQLGCTARMSDGTTSEVTSDCAWSLVSGVAFAALSDSGRLTAYASEDDHSVVVRATYAAAGVTKSTTRTIVITGVEPAPSAPVITRAGAGDYSAVILSWSAADHASSYRVYKCTGTTRPDEPLATVGNVLSYRDPDVEPGVEYRYWVSAVNTSGEAVSQGAVAYRAVQLTVGASAVSFDADGGVTNVTVKANAAVAGAAAEDWLAVSLGTSALTLTAQPNDSAEARTNLVTLTAGGSTGHPEVRVVVVYQSGRAAPAQGTPDLTFSTFDTDWDADYALYAAETENADRACRLFDAGEAIHVRYGWGNFGDGDAVGTVTNVIEIGSRHGDVESEAVDEREIELDVKTRNETVVDLDLEPGAVRADALASDAWKSLLPGVYIVRATLNDGLALAEQDEYNNTLGFRFAVRDPVSLATALDCEDSALSVSTISDQWYGTKGIGFDGADCAMTKLLGDGTSNLLTANVSGAGTLSFVYKVATEASYDMLSFKIDGTTALTDSGIGTWREVSFVVDAGDHTFNWTYSKDAIGSDGDDCVYLDHLVWTPVRAGVPPSDLVASTDKMSYVLLTWSAVSEAKSYVIERAPHDGTEWHRVYAGTSCRAYDDDTLGGVFYDYRIKTVYADGESGWSDVATGYRRAYVTSPAFRWVPSVSGMDGFTFSPNGRWSATTDATWLSIDTVAGTNACKFVYRYQANETDKERVAKITLTVGEPGNGSKTDGFWTTKTIEVKQGAPIVTGGTLPLAEAADTTLALVTSSDYPWIGQRRISHDGVAAIRSGAVGQNATSRVETVVATGGTLTFYWGSSSGTADKLTFYVNGVKQGTISGYTNTSAGRTNCTNWASVTSTIPEAGAVIAWEYVRSNVSGYGEDAAFVDQITWVPQAREVSPEDTWFMKYYPDLFDRLGVSWENRKSALAMPSPGTLSGGTSLGKRRADGTVVKVLDDYVAGTDPLDSDSLFRVQISLVNGVPKVSWSPVLDSEEADLRNYLIHGRESLSEGSWKPVAEGHESEFKFFKVTVEMQ